MKKYIVFSISFVISFVALQLIYGYFYSHFYAPDFASAWGQVENLPSSVVINGSSSFIPLLIVFLAITIAYFTAKVLKKSNT